MFDDGGLKAPQHHPDTPAILFYSDNLDLLDNPASVPLWKMAIMLELRNVTRSYGSHVAVKGLNLTLAPGDFLGLIGPNGAGKSTTLKMTVGHLKPTSGEVLLHGRDVQGHPLEVRRQVGYVPEYLALYEYLTGLEFLQFMGEVKGLTAQARTQEIDALLDVLDLHEERDRLVRTYSQGMRRKVALAGAMLGSPAVLVLDESLNGLDPTTNHRLKAHLQGLARSGTAILLSSHVLEVLERICNKIAVMRGGQLLELLDESALAQIRQAPGGLEQHFLNRMAEG